MAIVKLKPVLGLLVFASFYYNLTLLFGVVMNYDWALSRAAGGQFDSFPSWLRVIYFFMACAMGALAFLAWDFLRGNVSSRAQRVARIISIVFAFSTVLQLISRSVDERWNAIPAAILALSFWSFSRTKVGERREEN